MLKLRFIVVDRTREVFLKEGESFYLNRLRRFVHVDWKEVRPAKMTKQRPPKEVMDEEAENILKAVSNGDHVVALDRLGKQFDSETMASWLEQLSRDQVSGYVCFLIGGPMGLAKTILKEADLILSLSKLTMTHEMARLFLLEQVYRSMTIIKGHQYHK
jgi:23S rRNA (pseudouridine1915-N3)-methyltransferase